MEAFVSRGHPQMRARIRPHVPGSVQESVPASPCQNTFGTDPGTFGTDPGTFGTIGTDPGTFGTDPGTFGTDPETFGMDPGTFGTDPRTDPGTRGCILGRILGREDGS